jgi:2-phospho-L-lactate guanylyltransferase
VTTPRYALLIPVKDGRSAKSRLGVRGDDLRVRLMRAFARDSITAAAACEDVRVHVVGDANTLTDLLDGLDVEIVPDEGDGDLNRALSRAAARVRTPELGTAVLLADLPCLRTSDLTDALAAARGRAFVPDAAGTGTTLLIAPAGDVLDPRFGVGSARAHAASGAVEIGGGLDSLRLDVDTTEDLEAALVFGVGKYTAAATSSLA